jgi:hypothetical protein
MHIDEFFAPLPRSPPPESRRTNPQGTASVGAPLLKTRRWKGGTIGIEDSLTVRAVTGGVEVARGHQEFVAAVPLIA